MTGAERLVAQAVEQGFPEKITDPATLAQVAALLRTRPSAPKGARSESICVGRDGGGRHGS